jgi:acetyl esterase/lipase
MRHDSGRGAISRRWLALVLGPCLAALLLPAAGRAQAGPAGQEYAVRVIENVAYYTGKDADPVRHRLDLYLPEGKKDYPVLLLVHGGAWMLGDKTLFGWGPDIATYFAGRGIGVVMPSYRLSPGVRHPEHVKDVARAVAWTARHISEYGGQGGGLFLCGHSAGGHLVSLLATDPSYLRAEGLSAALIRGVISVSGVYRIPALNLSLDLPGVSPAAVRAVVGLFSPAAPTGDRAAKPAAAPQVRIPVLLFNTVFGSDPEVCAGASPLAHVRPGLPPFLLINAEHDWPLLPGMARDFVRALKHAGDPVQALQVKDRDHESVMFRASTADDPVASAIERFVQEHRGDVKRAAD